MFLFMDLVCHKVTSSTSSQNNFLCNFAWRVVSELWNPRGMSGLYKPVSQSTRHFDFLQFKPSDIIQKGRMHWEKGE